MTPGALATLELVRERIAVWGYAPKLDEIAEDLRISKTTAHARVEHLVSAGYLTKRAGAARGIALTETIDLKGVPTDALRAELGRRGATFESLNEKSGMAWTRRGVTCAADSCSLEVQRGQLFCRRHWFSLPRDLRDGILNAFGRKDERRYGDLVTKARDLIDGYRR